MTTHGLPQKEIAKADNTTIVHAFDDPDIIAGQGTIGLELLKTFQMLTGYTFL